MEPLRKVLSRHDRIMFAYRYGSRARGEEHEGSDLDIAIYTAKELHPRAISRLILDLEEAAGETVDLAILNEAGVVFQHQVLKEGDLIYVDDEQAQIEFETSVYSRYSDYKPFFDEYNRIRRAAVA